MSESSSKTKSEGGAFFVLVVIALVVAAWYLGMFPHLVRGETPNLVVSAGSGNLAPSLNLSSDSPLSWKAFSVTGGTAGQYQVLWAESDGTKGGIYVGTVSTSATAVGIGGIVAPPQPAPTPALATLATAVQAAAASLPAEQKAKFAGLYENLAASIDKGVIISPLQLQIGTGTQLLSVFSADELAKGKAITDAVNGYLDAQQCAQKLTADRIGDYAAIYHATAKALGGGYVPVPVSGHRGETKPEAPKATCPDGKCPAPAEQLRRWHPLRPRLDQ